MRTRDLVLVEEHLGRLDHARARVTVSLTWRREPGAPSTSWPSTHTTVRPEATTGRRSRSAAGTRRSIRKRLRLISRPALRTRSPGRRVRTVSGPAGTPTARGPLRCSSRATTQRPSGQRRAPRHLERGVKGRRGRAGRADADLVEIHGGFAAAGERHAPPGCGGPSGELDDPVHVIEGNPAQPARRANGIPDGDPRDRPRGLRHRRPREDGRPVLAAQPHRRGDGRHQLGLFREHGGRARQRLAHGGVEPALQVRDQLVADPVPEERGVGVGRILAPGQTVRGQVVEDVLPRDAQHRTQDPARAGAHGAEAGAARAPQQAQEDGLRLVVAGVREDDPRCAFTDANGLQEGVALEPRRLLDAAAVARRASPHVRAPDAHRDAERLAQAAAEGGIAGGVRPQAVVEMGGHQPEAARDGETVQRMQEGDRIRASRKAGDQRRTRGPLHHVAKRPCDFRLQGREGHN